MPLTLRRKEGETWLQAALRRSEYHELQTEVRAEYDAALAKGATEAQAAWSALEMWDLLAFETPGRGGWPIIDGSLCCPVCTSTKVGMTCRYPAFGTGSGGRGRLGDPGAREANVCGDCGETHSWEAGCLT
jgi:hypothetical protein